MKINELLLDFKIHTTNEEQTLLKKLTSIRPLHSFNTRDKFIIENLIRKALVSKIMKDKTVLVVKNDY